MPEQKIIIASYAAGESELRHVMRLAHGLRRFGGDFANVAVRAYLPATSDISIGLVPDELGEVGVECHRFDIPKETAWLAYAGKVYAAARAEQEAGDHNVVAYLDEDTLFIGEPTEFDLAPALALAYCPVMHNRTGTLYDQPADPLWRRVYDLLGVTDKMLFPMVTPADQQTIRAYFHAGLIVVRPERRIMRGWVDAFQRLANDPKIAAICRKDKKAWIFLHQMALVGPILSAVSQDEMRELPASYNYPILFERQFGGERTFDSIKGVVTVRHMVEPSNMGTEWFRDLKGNAEIVAWLYEQLKDSPPG